MEIRGFKDFEVFKISKKRKHDLGTHVCDLQFSHYQPQLFHRPGAACTAVTDKSCGFIVPFLIEKIECVFECAGDGVIIFGSNKNKGIECSDFCGPGPGMRPAVLSLRWWYFLVKKRKVIILNIYQLELGIASFFGNFINPFGYSFSNTAGACAPENNRNLQHVLILSNFT
jgi:hypothetical protein